MIRKQVSGGGTPTHVHTTQTSSKDRLLYIFFKELLSKVVFKQKPLEEGVRDLCFCTNHLAHAGKHNSFVFRPCLCLCSVLAYFAFRFTVLFLLSPYYLVCCLFEVYSCICFLPDCHVNSIVLSTTLEANISQGRVLTDSNSWNRYMFLDLGSTVLCHIQSSWETQNMEKLQPNVNKSKERGREKLKIPLHRNPSAQPSSELFIL